MTTEGHKRKFQIVFKVNESNGEQYWQNIMTTRNEGKWITRTANVIAYGVSLDRCCERYPRWCFPYKPQVYHPSQGSAVVETVQLASKSLTQIHIFTLCTRVEKSAYIWYETKNIKTQEVSKEKFLVTITRTQGNIKYIMKECGICWPNLLLMHMFLMSRKLSDKYKYVATFFFATSSKENKLQCEGFTSLKGD